AYKKDAYGEGYLREEIIKTARSFIGLPYLWGGTSADTGFDCSGLAMAVYRLNGLDLPRSSAEQYEKGEPVSRGDLEKGDLVFFSAGGKINHVGIYVGEGRFIHAPGRGKTVRYDSLDLSYFRNGFRGARSYM
ncbi:MAG: C40 family peptidase, partial [Thermodesulfobacteriota bacterium]